MLPATQSRPAETSGLYDGITDDEERIETLVLADRAQPIEQLDDRGLQDRFYVYRGAHANCRTRTGRQYCAAMLALVAEAIIRREAWFGFWVDGEVRDAARHAREEDVPRVGTLCEEDEDDSETIG